MRDGYSLGLGGLYRITEDTEGFKVVLEDCTFIRDYYYPEKMFKTLFGQQWEIKDRVINITVLKESPPVILGNPLSREQKISNNEGFEFFLTGGATTAISPVEIPYITIPAKINIDGNVIDTQVRGIVIYGEILIDAEQILNLTGKLK